MLFLNPWLLAGLVGIGIPILIHLVRQQAAKPLDWGAMRFLFDTVSMRRRKMEWEDLLLMAARCLLLGLLAMALARPFVTPDSQVPWLFVLPAALLGVALFGGSFVLSAAKPRWLVRLFALALLLAMAGLVVFEQSLNLRRFQASGRRDVALVIDASASMELTRDGRSVFSRAIDEARQLVMEAPRGTAFSVILGGPAPEARTATPLTHRADVLGLLDSLEPVGGGFRAHEALGMATLGLAEGTNASKEIIVFTDAQRGGWRLDNPAAWDGLEQAWDAMPAKPKLLVRGFGVPEDFSNIALPRMELSRSVIGTDREVVVRVTVANTGVQPLTPGPLVLEVDGEPAGEAQVGLLVPGQTEVAEFRHRFTAAGPRVVGARIAADDDLPSDNHLEQVVAVRDTLPVLLVDGNPAGSFFERAAGYPALALAPSADLLGGSPAGDGFLMDPRVVAASALSEADLDGAAVVVLADVSRLPERLARRLANKVADGTGLMIIAGPRVDPAFYNSWQGADGPLVPLALGDEAVDEEGISPAGSTFVHEALAGFGAGGDLVSARVNRWRATGGAVDGGVQAAAFSNGSAFLASRHYGSGRVWLVCCALDGRAGNLPAKRAFVPLVHELVSWAAGGGVDLNVDAVWSPSIALVHRAGGLTSEYFPTHDRRRPAQTRGTDSAIDFGWGGAEPAAGIPKHGFAAVWSGSLVAPVTGDYLFESDVSQRIEVEVAGRRPMKVDGSGLKRLGTVALEAGRPVPIRVAYEHGGGDAHARLFWTPPGGKREIVPPGAFLPSGDEIAGSLAATDPRGREREASLRRSRGGIELAIAGPAVPGIYRVAGDERLAGLVAGAGDGTVPAAVRRDPGESHFEPMTEADLALIRKHIDLVEPRSVADIVGVMHGKAFGREIWKWLALAAFVFFMLESVLARWVSRSRRSGEEIPIDFGGAGPVPRPGASPRPFGGLAGR
jgi:hypothetical protein